jgi:hypothetical protein
MDTATVNVTSGNVAPVAVTDGPWSGLPNTPIVFDGSASYDPNACTTPGNPICLGDSIVSYEWDLNGNGVFNEPGIDGTPVVAGDYKKVTKSFPNPISLPATLKVTDSYGLVGTSSAQLNIVSITLVFGQQYDICYRKSISRFVEELGIQVKFKNLGNAPAENLIMTLTNVPSNLTIIKGVANLGTLAAGAETSTACGPDPTTADIVLKFDRRIVPSGQWLWKADFDMGGSHYTVDNIPPLP